MTFCLISFYLIYTKVKLGMLLLLKKSKRDLKMSKRDILLLFTLLFAFEVSIAEAQEVSEEVSEKDMVACTVALVKMRSLNVHTSQGDYDSNYFNASAERSFRYFWKRSPVNEATLNSFAGKIHAKRNQGDLNIYETELINAIFSFMSQMRSLIKSHHINTDVLPDYIQKVIGLFDQLSPVEMFIHTHVMEIATKRLEGSHEINFEYREYEFKELLESLPRVLRSTEQKIYSALREEPNKIIAEMSQDSHIEKSEGQMRVEGYIEPYILGLSYVNSQLKFAQFLKRSSADAHITHIRQFADLIDLHINFIRKALERQKSFDQNARLRQLDMLVAEAQSKKKDEEMTYAWWFMFNLRLAILVTPDRHRNANYLLDFDNDSTGDLIRNVGRLETLYLESIYNNNRENFESEDINIVRLFELINEFPNRIMIPTIISDLGMIAKNKLYQGNRLNQDGVTVTFIRLDNQPSDDNGVFTYPDNRFINSVIRHITNRSVDNGSQLFKFYFYRKLVGLTKPEREVVEYICFQLTSEEFTFLEFINDKNSLTRHTKQNNNNYYTSLLRVLPDGLSQNYDGVEEFLNRGEETTIRLVSEVSEELSVIRRSSVSNLSEQQIRSLYYLLADHFIK